MGIRGGSYSFEVAFFGTEGAETLPVSDHFVATDCTLSFMEELDGRKLSERRDAILWEKLTKSTSTDTLGGKVPQVVDLDVKTRHEFLDFCKRVLFAFFNQYTYADCEGNHSSNK
jgi:hypothetical protein